MEILETKRKEVNRMTFTTKSEKINNYYIEISQTKFCQGYTVEASKTHDDGATYTRTTSNVYPTIKQANARYNYLKRKAKAGEL